MTIGDLKRAFRDLPDETEVYLAHQTETMIEYRSLKALEIERSFEGEEITDCFNIVFEN